MCIMNVNSLQSKDKKKTKKKHTIEYGFIANPTEILYSKSKF